MSESDKRAYVIADNKLALNAGWDEDLLTGELQWLLSVESDIDVSLTGFTIAEVDSLIEGQKPEEPGNPEDDQLPPDGSPRFGLGDIWQLGPHRLICGDSREPAVVALLMDAEKAQMVFTDPPYNVPIAGHVGGLAIAHREFAMAAGEMDRTAFTAFLSRVFQNELKNLIVWVKDNGGMGTFYRSRHELIFAYKNGSAPLVSPTMTWVTASRRRPIASGRASPATPAAGRRERETGSPHSVKSASRQSTCRRPTATSLFATATGT